MSDPIMDAVLGNANMKIVYVPDVDADMRKLADEAIKTLIGQEVAPSYDPALEPMRTLARAADRLGVLIECDNEDHNGAGEEDVAAYDGLLRVLARWQATYGDASRVNPKQAADDVALALHGAIARVEIAHQEGSDIMKAALPDMKAALAAYYRMSADSEIGMLRSPRNGELEADLAAAQRRAAFFEEELQEARRDLGEWDGTPESLQTIQDNINLCLAGGSDKAYGGAEPPRDGPSNAKASAGLQLMKDAIAEMEGVWLGEVKSDFGGGWIGDINMADGTRVLANFSAHGHIDLGIKPKAGPFKVAIIRQVDLSQKPTSADLRANLQSAADVVAAAAAESPVGKLLAHVAITHDTLSELAENGELPSAIQSRVADHLEEGTALFRAAGIESEPAPITAESLRR